MVSMCIFIRPVGNNLANLFAFLGNVFSHLLDIMRLCRPFVALILVPLALDLREEFTRAICREVEYESNLTAKLVAQANDENEQKIDLVMKQIELAENRLRAETTTTTRTTTTRFQ